MEENELLPAKSGNDYLQMMPIDQAISNYQDFHKFVSGVLKKDLDYGVIPGTNKPSLYKPGAEKLRFVYGLGVEFEAIESTVNVAERYVNFSYRCTIRSRTGQVLAQCEGNCNSEEAKFGYLWKAENELPAGIDKSQLLSKVGGKKMMEFGFAIEKAETSGQYGKPAAYWEEWKAMIADGRAKRITKKSKAGKDLEAWEADNTVTQYRIKNPEVVGLQNTIMKMAQKRAFVGAILIATGASEYFTQDIEDMDLTGKGDIYSDKNPVPGFVEDISHEEVPPAANLHSVPGDQIAGLWYARLEKCKTPEAVDDLCKKYSTVVNAQPALRKLFVVRKHELKKQAQKPLKESTEDRGLGNTW
jgi:hypothetical protein